MHPRKISLSVLQVTGSGIQVLILRAPSTPFQHVSHPPLTLLVYSINELIYFIMLSTKSWIYLDLQKSGCTFLRDALQKIFGVGCFVDTRKHINMVSMSPLPKLITIRDPFGYYFSLWSYGLDGRGKIFSQISDLSPTLARKMYASRSQECFAAFLDYVLNSPARYINKSRSDWLPLSLDLYTARILSLIVPFDSREIFLERLGCDYPSKEKIVEASSPFVPEIIIRTASLNSDFHRYADSGSLSFMGLPAGWKKDFPLNSSKKNTSSSSLHAVSEAAYSVRSLWMSGWRSAVERKSGLSLWMLDLASSRLRDL